MNSPHIKAEGDTCITHSLHANSEQVRQLLKAQEHLLKEIALDIHLNRNQTKVQPHTEGKN